MEDIQGFDLQSYFSIGDAPILSEHPANSVIATVPTPTSRRWLIAPSLDRNRCVLLGRAL